MPAPSVAPPSRGIVPIGSILPYIGDLDSLGPDWALCTGQTLTDAGSPLNGMQLPNLSDNRFLMGVGKTEKVGVLSGDNILKKEGGFAGGEIATGDATRGAGWGNLPGGGHQDLNITDVAHQHRIALPALAAHDHGGDKRPRSCSVWFICRIR